MGLDLSKFPNPNDHGKVQVMNSKSEWLAKLDEAKASGKMIVVDFTAAWCGPCQTMAPIFVQLSNQYEQVMFIKVDVDSQPEIAREWGVQAMPTFIFIQDGKPVERIMGANKAKLESQVARYAQQYVAKTPATASAS